MSNCKGIQVLTKIISFKVIYSIKMSLKKLHWMRTYRLKLLLLWFYMDLILQSATKKYIQHLIEDGKYQEAVSTKVHLYR